MCLDLHFQVCMSDITYLKTATLMNDRRKQRTVTESLVTEQIQVNIHK